MCMLNILLSKRESNLPLWHSSSTLVDVPRSCPLDLLSLNGGLSGLVRQKHVGHFFFWRGSHPGRNVHHRNGRSMTVKVATHQRIYSAQVPVVTVASEPNKSTGSARLAAHFLNLLGWSQASLRELNPVGDWGKLLSHSSWPILFEPFRTPQQKCKLNFCKQSKEMFSDVSC